MVGDFVVTHVQVRDGVVLDEARHEHAKEVVVQQVAAQHKSGQGFTVLDGLGDRGRVGYFHPEQHAFVLHADLLHPVGKVQLRQVRQHFCHLG